MDRKLNPSYSSTTSTSAGLRSVRVHSWAAASRAAMVVMSSNWSHDGRPRSAVPTASTRATGCPTPAACSAADTTTAVEPSTGASQSYKRNGVVTMRDAK
jgi:hypothetical protein